MSARPGVATLHRIPGDDGVATLAPGWATTWRRESTICRAGTRHKKRRAWLKKATTSWREGGGAWQHQRTAALGSTGGRRCLAQEGGDAGRLVDDLPTSRRLGDDLSDGVDEGGGCWTTGRQRLDDLDAGPSGSSFVHTRQRRLGTDGWWWSGKGGRRRRWPSFGCEGGILI